MVVKTLNTGNGGISGAGKTIILFFIRFYQKVISPHLAPSCRFYPSCSAYAYKAVETHGAARGIVLAVWRLLRCHPLSKGGYDPVPQRKR